MSTLPLSPSLPSCGLTAPRRTWWRRALSAWLDRPARAFRQTGDAPTWSEQDLRSLRGLSAGTLRDIGAPDWVHEGRDERARVMLDLMRL